MKKISSVEQYHNLIASDQVTIVKYFTNWCPDCKNMDRFIDEVIQENSDKVWAEMDAEQFQDIAEQNEVRGIPTLVAYKNGKKIGHLHSKFAKTPSQVKQFLNHLSE